MKSAIIPRPGCKTIILSAQLAWRDNTRNSLDHIELADRLGRQFGIGELTSVQACNGVYKGIPERSIAITGKSDTVKAIAQREAERFSQESVLVIDYRGQGWLHYTATGEREHIGEYSPVHGANDDHTVVLATDEKFTFI